MDSDRSRAVQVQLLLNYLIQSGPSVRLASRSAEAGQLQVEVIIQYRDGANQAECSTEEQREVQRQRQNHEQGVRRGPGCYPFSAR
ncbi:MAG: hypothetical protein J07HR59_00534 [Halorubrum sp. J07HR59]|nr:MAG: hypothetical protein J07HR59_00534 [Halorubrum sp. J07HR59]